MSKLTTDARLVLATLRGATCSLTCSELETRMGDTWIGQRIDRALADLVSADLVTSAVAAHRAIEYCAR